MSERDQPCLLASLSVGRGVPKEQGLGLKLCILQGSGGGGGGFWEELRGTALQSLWEETGPGLEPLTLSRLRFCFFLSPTGSAQPGTAGRMK